MAHSASRKKREDGGVGKEEEGDEEPMIGFQVMLAKQDGEEERRRAKVQRSEGQPRKRGEESFTNFLHRF